MHTAIAMVLLKGNITCSRNNECVSSLSNQTTDIYYKQAIKHGAQDERFIFRSKILKHFRQSLFLIAYMPYSQPICSCLIASVSYLI